MEYPSLNQYIDAIQYADSFEAEALQALRPVKMGRSVAMSSGNYAVVFKMKHEETGELFALKCFTRHQEGRAEAYRQIEAELRYVDSSYFIRLQYLDNAIWAGDYEHAFPVLLMPWVEGKTLEVYVNELAERDPERLHLVAYKFSVMASWLVNQPFAHGDIKPDNIMVRADGSMVLVDYDGLYVPSMQGTTSREAGTPAFRHPRRSEMPFGEQIDDFPLVSINLSLYLIALNPKLLKTHGAKDRLLFSEADYQNLSASKVLPEIVKWCHDSNVQRLYGLFLIALSEGHLQRCENRLMLLPPPTQDFKITSLQKQIQQPQISLNAHQQATTAERTFTVKGVTFKMIYVEGGSFMMGAPDYDNGALKHEKPAHRVSLDGYYIAETQVTQELWYEVMGDNPSCFKGYAQRPVDNVSWNACQEFIKKLNQHTGQKFSLPTEAQWEYAARGGKKSKGYKYAGGNDLSRVAYYRVNSNCKTHPVRQKLPNELGLYDMSGNVWEWCRDWFDGNYYAISPQHNPEGPALGGNRVLRGGSYSNDWRGCRLSCRGGNPPAIRFWDRGLRLVLPV